MRVRFACCFLLFCSFAALQVQAQSSSPYDSVDPIIGTTGSGNTFPGATLPFGMVQWSPDNESRGLVLPQREASLWFQLDPLERGGMPSVRRLWGSADTRSTDDESGSTLRAGDFLIIFGRAGASGLLRRDDDERRAREADGDGPGGHRSIYLSAGRGHADADQRGQQREFGPGREGGSEALRGIWKSTSRSSRMEAFQVGRARGISAGRTRITSCTLRGKFSKLLHGDCFVGRMKRS